MLKMPFRLVCFVLACLAIVSVHPAVAEDADPAKSLTMIVMDPLAAPLACPCVQGYAQRDYEKLAEHLGRALGRKVEVVFDESLEAAAKKNSASSPAIVIGKKSVVEHDAKATKLPLKAVAALTDLQGITTQTGMFVVAKDAEVQSLSELGDFKILFGPQDCDEKHAAALTSLKSHGINPPEKLETSDSCSDGAALVVEAGPKKKLAAVISSYAKPLLEGCGTIKKGDLRVVGETAPVAFIEAFLSDSLPKEDRSKLSAALLGVKDDPLLCHAIETRDGFVALTAIAAAETPSAPKVLTVSAQDSGAKKK